MAWLVTGMAVVVGWWVANRTVHLANREPGVSRALLTRPWVENKIGRSGVVLDAPWRLQGIHVPLPKEMSGKVNQWTWIGHEGEGFNVMAARVVYSATIPATLEGAADGMIKNIEGVAGTRSVTPTRTETKLLGHRAIEIGLQIEREKGLPLHMRGLVVLRGQELIQLLAIAREDQELASQVWTRMRDSLRAD